MFNKKDIEYIERHGLNMETVEKQMENFRNGFGFLPVDRPATLDDGIRSLDRESAEHFAEIFKVSSADKSLVKFVPASGAATRMFKDLFEYIENGELTEYIEKFIERIRDFPFYETVVSKMGDMRATVKAVLNYGARLPKALILFHHYSAGSRTALEEHLVEGAMYATSDGKVRMHSTISPEHEAGFRKVLAEKQGFYEDKFGVKYEIVFSQQDKATDTIAVTPENEPFREEDGSLLFRPAGHGALIGNLNDIDGDIIFIKTVDNVTIDRLKGDTVLYKKALGGILMDLQSKIFEYLEAIDDGVDAAAIADIREFLSSELSIKLPEDIESRSEGEQGEFLRRLLDRPLRVCGMVRNEGEPGGGPFWVHNQDGTLSLQIAEPSQLSPEQKSLLEEGTHFNPVDLVCATGNYKGKRFDLTQYTDPSTGLISKKSKKGRILKAQELPGLWNGAMANWNTVFAEVPISTFTPVKVVNDLLRPQHQ